MQKHFLFAHWEGGGNTPPVLSLVRGLIQRGHCVRVLSDPCNRDEVLATGASFAAWTGANKRDAKTSTSDFLQDWEAASATELVGRLRDRVFVGPALDYAKDILAQLREFPAQVIAASEMLLGAMAGAEAAGIPCVAISANVCFYPLPGVPPFGPGLTPATNVFGRLRDTLVRSQTLREFGKGTAQFNAARKTLGLEALPHPLHQERRVARHLVLTSAAFDFPSSALPERMVYTGPVLDDPSWVAPWQSPWPDDDRRPLVLAGFSTTFQNQAAVLQQVIDALGSLEVRGVVTLGPAMDIAAFAAPANVHLCKSAPHGEILRQASLAITHCGHGTTIRALAAGVPLVCMPMGRDQNDNAARVVARGAGVRLSPSANASVIRQGIQAVLQHPRYRERAQALGKLIVEDARQSPALDILESLALTTT